MLFIIRNAKLVAILSLFLGITLFLENSICFRTKDKQSEKVNAAWLAPTSSTYFLKEKLQVASILLRINQILTESSIGHSKDQQNIESIKKTLLENLPTTYLESLQKVSSIYMEEDGLLYVDYEEKDLSVIYRLRPKNHPTTSLNYTLIESLNLNNGKVLEKVIKKLTQEDKSTEKASNHSWRKQEHATYYQKSEKIYIAILTLSFVFLVLFYSNFFPLFLKEWAQGHYLWIVLHTTRLSILPFFILGAIHLLASNLITLWEILRGNLNEDTKFTAFTVPEIPSGEFYPSITGMVPVYHEDWKVIKENLDALVVAIRKYNQIALQRDLNLISSLEKNPEKLINSIRLKSEIERTPLETNLLSAHEQRLANIIVCDDFIMPLCKNNFYQFLENINLKMSSKQSLSNSEKEFITRVNYYKKNNITFVARPIHNSIFEKWSFIRKGLFKKGSNLNHTHLLEDRIQSLKKQGYRYDEALKISKNIPIKLKNETLPIFCYTVVEGYLVIGDLILLLDKDSIVPKNVLWKTSREFINNPLLAYTQNETKPIPPTNYVEKTITIITTGLHSYSIIYRAKYGFLPFVGHNGILRKKALKQIGYWNEHFVAEDFDMAQSMATSADPETGHWYYGKGVFYKGETILEGIPSSFSAQSVQSQKNGVGSIQLWSHPIQLWFKEGIINKKFKKFLKANHIPWHTRLDHFLSIFMLASPVFLFFTALLHLVIGFTKTPDAYISIPFYISVIGLFFLFAFAYIVVITHIGEFKENQNKSSLSNSISRSIVFLFRDLIAINVLYGGQLLYSFLGSFSYLIGKPKTCAATPTDKPNYKHTLKESISYILKNSRLSFVSGGLAFFLLFLAGYKYPVASLFSTVNIYGMHMIVVFILLAPFLFEPSFLNAVKKTFIQEKDSPLLKEKPPMWRIKFPMSLTKTQQRSLNIKAKSYRRYPLLTMTPDTYDIATSL